MKKTFGTNLVSSNPLQNFELTTAANKLITRRRRY